MSAKINADMTEPPHWRGYPGNGRNFKHQWRKHMNTKLVGKAALLALWLGAASVQAQTNSNDPSPWTFSGYGTLGYSHEDEPNLKFVRDLGQKASSTHSGSWKTDSRIGLQAGYRISPQTDAVAQLVLRDKTDATLGNSVEWAYLSHRPLPELNLRVGRVGIDVFLLSDYRNLGYAQTTVRPNWDYYGFMPIYSLDGLDASYTLNTDAARWNLKAQLGRVEAAVPMMAGNNYHFVADNFVDVSVVREAGPWRLKGGLASMSLANEAPLGALTQPLAAVAGSGIPGISNEANSLLSGLRFKDGRISYLTVGASYDDGLWQAQGELSRVSGNRQVYVQGTAAYLNVGRRFASITPYVGISAFHPRDSAAVATHDWAAVLGNEGGVLQAMAIGATNLVRINQRTVSLGMRWDFHSQASLKLQFDRIHILKNGNGLWGGNDSAPVADERANLVTATIDWVF